MTERLEKLLILCANITTGKYHYPDELIHQTIKTWEQFDKKMSEANDINDKIKPSFFEEFF